VRRRALTIVLATVLALTTGAAPALARPADTYPDSLSLPDGFQPEGIAIGKLPYAYFGSRTDGAILRVCLRTGKSSLLSPGPGTPSLGLKLDDRGRLFVAGGTGGDARVLDATTGKVLASYELQAGHAFINDVVLTGNAAWFTDSVNPVLFKLPFGKDGELPDQAVRVPITGAMTYQSGINANGITATPDGHGLLIVQSNTGRLFRSTYAGRTTKLGLTGESLLNGDGMWLRGSILYVVQNRDNAITKLQLDKEVDDASVLSRTKDARFDVPTTIAEWNGTFYLPDARFTTTATPDTTYSAVSVAIP
jgi:hypothetical protein